MDDLNHQEKHDVQQQIGKYGCKGREIMIWLLYGWQAERERKREKGPGQIGNGTKLEIAFVLFVLLYSQEVAVPVFSVSTRPPILVE